MSPASLAVCFGPVLMLHSEEAGPALDFQQPIAVLKYLLEIWPVKSGNVVVLNTLLFLPSSLTQLSSLTLTYSLTHLFTH